MTARTPVNHYEQAERCLSQSEFRHSARPDADFVNPQASMILIAQAEAHMKLAAMPAQVVMANDEAKRLRSVLDDALQVVAGHLGEMLVSSVPEVRKWAAGIATELDRIGQNVDGRIRRRAERLGCGPDLFDHEGIRYSLLQMWVDAKGKRWEHSGDWTAHEKPVMRREDKAEQQLALPELIESRGPLMQPKSPPPRKTSGFSDEPPF